MHLFTLSIILNMQITPPMLGGVVRRKSMDFQIAVMKILNKLSRGSDTIEQFCCKAIYFWNITGISWKMWKIFFVIQLLTQFKLFLFNLYVKIHKYQRIVGLFYYIWISEPNYRNSTWKVSSHFTDMWTFIS